MEIAMSPNEILVLRKELGWTQADLGDAVGVGKASVSLWESGAQTPSGSAEILLGQIRARADLERRKKIASQS